MSNDRIAELLRETPPGLPPGRHDLREVERRRSRRRLVTGALTALVVILATGVPLLVLSSLAGNRTQPPVPGTSTLAPTSPPSASPPAGPPQPSPSHIEGAETIEAHGLAIDVPSGWFSSVWPGFDYPVLLMSSIPLPKARHFPDVDERATLDADGVLISLQENTELDPCSEYPTPPLPIRILPEDFLTPEGIELPSGHAWADKIFVVGDRCFSMHVEYGSDPPTGPSLHAVDAIMASLNVSDLPEPPPPSPSPPPGWETGSVGWIVCTDHGIEIRTPHVEAQADGFHFRIDNLVKADFVWFGGPDHPMVEIGGHERRDDVFAMAPGSTSAACAAQIAGRSLSISDIPPDAYAPLSLDDPEGLWHHGSLECDPTRFVVRLEGRFTDQEELIAALRDQLVGLEPDDTILLEGFPEPDRVGQLFVTRGERTIATINAWLALEHKDPIISGEACPDIGLSSPF